MFKFICLGSGSCGNCYYLNAEGYGIIIDMGLGLRSMKKHFRDYGPVSYTHLTLPTILLV